MSIEHRSERSASGIALSFNCDNGNHALELASTNDSAVVPNTLNVRDRVLDELRNSSEPLSLNRLRANCKARKETVSRTVADLVDKGVVAYEAESGYRLVPETGSHSLYRTREPVPGTTNKVAN
jgi:predicted transcriptional regulator